MSSVGPQFLVLHDPPLHDPDTRAYLCGGREHPTQVRLVFWRLACREQRQHVGEQQVCDVVRLRRERLPVSHLVQRDRCKRRPPHHIAVRPGRPIQPRELKGEQAGPTPDQWHARAPCLAEYRGLRPVRGHHAAISKVQLGPSNHRGIADQPWATRGRAWESRWRPLEWCNSRPGSSTLRSHRVRLRKEPTKELCEGDPHDGPVPVCLARGPRCTQGL